MTFRVSEHDPRLENFMRDTGLAGGSTTTHVVDILGCGESGITDKATAHRALRVGTLKIQESKFTHVGIEPAQSPNF